MLAIPNMVKWASVIRQSFQVKPAFVCSSFCAIASQVERQRHWPTIIIDSGNGFLKAGISRTNAFPTVIRPSSDDIWLRKFWLDESPLYDEGQKRESIVCFESLEKVDVNSSEIVIKISLKFEVYNSVYKR